MNENENNNLKPIDILDVLLDSSNTEPIVLTDGNGKMIEFEQIAVIPHMVNGEKKIYCLLKPITSIDGIADDEVVIFYVDVFDGGSTLKVETDEATALEVYDKYLQLLQDSND